MSTLSARVYDTARQRARLLTTRLGSEIRLARVAAGLSQAQLASRAGFSQTTVSLAERGHPYPLDVYARLVTAAGCDLSVRRGR